MQTSASCCPGRPAHSRSRTFFKAAATLAFIVGGVSGTVGIQALAIDYTNPLGTTVGSQFYPGGTLTNFTNNGTVTGGFLTYNSHSNPISSFTNTGLIQGASGYAIQLFDHSPIITFTNSGTISSTNDDAIFRFDHSPITTLNNSGTISATGGHNAIGFFYNSGITTLNNSGTISATGGGHAISFFDGTITTINLLPGSIIVGGIENFGTIGTLNVYKTVTNPNFDSVSLIPTITGNQPGTTNLYLTTPDNCKYVTVGNHAAGVDTSAFGANTNAIRHVSNSVGRLANTNGVIQSIGTKIAKHNADPYVMTSDLCADGAPAQPGQIGNSDFWIRGFMGRNRVDATASSTDYINTYSGGAVGIERDWSEDVRAGAFIGAGITDNSLGGALGGSEADLLFAGAYATKTWGTLFAKVGLTGGRGNNTGTRNIAAATPETATADYNSWYVSPEVSVGKVYDLGQRLGGTLSVTPVLSVRYVYAHQDGYTETGATNNLTMNNSHSTTIEERAELKFSYATKAFNDYGVKINASVGGIGQQNSGGAMSGTLLGAPLSFATPGDDNTTGFVGGLGFEINRGKYTFTASGDYVRLSGGNADLSANVVFSVKF